MSGEPLSGNTALELWQPDGRAEVLTPDPAAYQPAISPDGRTVAFALGEGSWSDGTGWDQSRVAILTVDTHDVTVLSADLPDTSVYNLKWSWDGSEIAFLRLGIDLREIAAVRVGDRSERGLLDVSGGDAFDFAWSPDGQELLVPTFLLGEPGSQPAGSSEELRRYSIETGEYLVVPTPHTIIDEVAWSPDGRLLAMEADIPGTFRTRLFVLDLESGTSQPVDRRRGGPQSMTWSGPYLIYTYELRSAEHALRLMSWDSRSQERAHSDRPGLDHFNSYEATISAPRCLSWP